LAYVFDPTTNTLIDDEDKSLGNKFAVMDSELEKAIQELNEKFGSGSVQQGTQGIPQPPIKIPQAIFEFEERMKGRMAEGGSIRQEFAPKNKIRLAGTMAPGKYEFQAASSKWLPNYSYADLLSDLEKGLSKMEIAKNIYQNNKELYDKIPVEGSIVEQYRNVEDAKVAKISNAIKNRLQKKPQLNKLNEKNTATLKKLENSVVKDVDKWIKNNKSKYIGKQGAYKLFENDLFKFLEKDYSRLIKTSKGLYDSTIAGDKFISKFANRSGYASSTDEASNYRAVKKKLYEGLGINFGVDKTGETTKTFKKTKEAVKKLLPIAQKKGIIPKTYMGGKAKNKVIKITPQNYFEFLKQTEALPMKKIFANMVNFSVEHPGGLSRAAEILDAETLGKIISLERGEFGEDIRGKKISANLVKGQKYDTQISKLVKKAQFETTDLSKAKNFLKEANVVSKKAANEFGTLQSTYTATKGGDGKIQIKVKHPKISLNDSLVSKTKNAIHSFIANNGMNRDVFNKLPEKLKKAVTLINDNKNADAVLKSHIKDIFPEEGKGVKLNSFAGVIDFDMIPDNVKATVAKGANALGKSLRVLGFATAPLDVFPFSEQSAKGLRGTDLLKTGGAKLIEDYLNAPQSIASLFGKELYEPFTFGNKYADKIEASIPMEERILNQKNLAFDKTMPRLVDDIDIAPSKNELEEMRKNFIENVDIDTSKNLPFMPLEEDKTELSPIIKSLVTPDETLQDFMANGGRVGFSNGGSAGADENFATELEYFLTNEDAELPQLLTFKETKNPLEIINDIIDPRNYAYYANKIGARTVLRIAEFAGRIGPATGKLISDLIQKPAFKIKKTSNNYVQDYMEELPPSNVTGTGIFSEFLKNITPTSLEKKIGLDKTIKEQEQKLIDRGSTVGPVVFSDTISLGAEVTAPIFPGAKLLNAFAKNRNLPVNDVTKKILVKEIDEVLETKGMNRREFLQATGAGATIVLAKMLGFGDELAQTAKVAETATKGGGVPPYFFDLVEIIKKKGMDVTKRNATKNLENVYSYKGYDVYEDLATGTIRVEKTNMGANITIGEDGIKSQEMMEFRPGVADEGTKGKPADEFEQGTVYPDAEGKMKDLEEGEIDIEEILEFIKNEKAN